MKEELWIDDATRGFGVTFTVYNTMIWQRCVSFTVEFMAGGRVLLRTNLIPSLLFCMVVVIFRWAEQFGSPAGSFFLCSVKRRLEVMAPRGERLLDKAQDYLS